VRISRIAVAIVLSAATMAGTSACGNAGKVSTLPACQPGKPDIDFKLANGSKVVVKKNATIKAGMDDCRSTESLQLLAIQPDGKTYRPATTTNATIKGTDVVFKMNTTYVDRGYNKKVTLTAIIANPACATSLSKSKSFTTLPSGCVKIGDELKVVRK
jgi:hypothetical protein